MMKAPSVTPTARKNLVCNSVISSGCRAQPSSIFIEAMPTPMHEPSAGMAMSTATASGRMSLELIQRAFLLEWE